VTYAKRYKSLDIVRYAHSSRKRIFTDVHHFLRHSAKNDARPLKSFWRRVSEANNVVSKYNRSQLELKILLRNEIPIVSGRGYQKANSLIPKCNHLAQLSMINRSFSLAFRFKCPRTWYISPLFTSIVITLALPQVRLQIETC
jgi:hypothetical protein